MKPNLVVELTEHAKVQIIERNLELKWIAEAILNLFPSSAIALRDFAPNCPTCEGESQRIFSVPHFNLSTGSAF